ncbi:hypothetical protein HYZ97_00725 [Candidatus Pacearchaeota archaeon]|nr:hypothetical protein [Candidatus Pacearchaeota archaeon]
MSHQKANHLAIHDYQVHYGRYPFHVAEQLIETCTGFNITYGKMLHIEMKGILDTIHTAVQQAGSRGDIWHTSDIEQLMNVTLKDSQDVLAMTHTWDATKEIYDWCHISGEEQPDQENTIICISPTKKHCVISVSALSEKYLECAAREVGIFYRSNRFQRGRHPRRDFYRLFPQLNEASIPRIYKQRLVDFQDYRWMRRRKVNRLDPETMEKQRSNAARFIEKAFDAYEIERRAKSILRFREDYRSKSGFLWGL